MYKNERGVPNPVNKHVFHSGTAIWLLFLFLSLMTACNKNKFEDDTYLFDQYLQSGFHFSIPEDTTYFIVMSEQGCIGCIEKNVDAMKNNEKTVFVVSDHTYHKYLEPEHVAVNKCLIDTTGTLLRLKFHKYNVGIVQCAHKKIYNIIHMTYSQTDSVLAKVSKL